MWEKLLNQKKKSNIWINNDNNFNINNNNKSEIKIKDKKKEITKLIKLIMEAIILKTLGITKQWKWETIAKQNM